MTNSIGRRLASLSEDQLTAFARQFENARAELRRLTEPVAIVGMACRFPGGADSPDAFWSLLQAQADVCGPPPAERGWSAAAAKPGYFLVDPFRFDWGLLGIAPREARAMDPQQRILLELAWQALEDGGYAPHSLAGSRTGVFAGCYGDDFAHQLVWSNDVGAVDAHTGTGTSHAAAVGRVAFQLNLVGPAVAVDTACSSSLVAVHDACGALRNGDCDFALAGGVSLSLSAETTLVLDRARMLSADGRSKAFDRDADGYGRGEGGGLVLLRRLSDAERDKDPILAVIRGSAVNHNGRASSLTAPSGEAQADVIARALKHAGLEADSVGAIECFGAGSAMGDSIEARALRKVFAPGRPSDRPLVLGSVKSNVGHLEAAAGIAGLIKMVLAMRNEEVPATLHVRNLNPDLEEDSGWMSLARTPVAWPKGGAPRIAGISAFGFGGTNAHVVIAEAPPSAAREEEAEPVAGRVLALSSSRPDGIAPLAAIYLDALVDRQVPLADLCYTANVGRSPRAHRALAKAETRAEAIAGLEALISAGPAAAPSAPVRKPAPSTLFMFVGQGTQFGGMGRDLYERVPSFREAFGECEAILGPIMGFRVADLLYGERQELLSYTQHAQPALFAYNYAFAKMLMRMGVSPDAFIGHSLGEYVAAHLAGVFDLETALRLVVDRGNLMGSLPAGGAMAALTCDGERAMEIAGAFGLDVAAINGARQAVLSGPEAGIEAAIEAAAREKVAAVRLDVSHAFHSALMDPIAEAFSIRLAKSSLRPPSLPVYSNLTGKRETEALATVGYWSSHLRRTVRFAEGYAAAAAAGFSHVVEIGPRTALASLVRAVTPAGCAVHSAPKPGEGPLAALSALLGPCYLDHYPVDWAEIQEAMGGRRATIAPGAMGGERLVSDVGLTGERRFARALASDGGSSLAGRRIAIPGSRVVLHQAELTARSPGVADHRLLGAAVIPGGFYLAVAILAADDGPVSKPWLLRGIHFAEPLILRGEDAVDLLTVAQGAGDRTTIDIFSRASETDPEIKHSSLTAMPLDAELCLSGPDDDSAMLPPSPQLYERMRSAGYEVGPSFKWLSEIRCADGVAAARLSTPAGVEGFPHRHPGFFDSCFQLLAAAAGSLGAEGSEDAIFVPAAIDELAVWPAFTGALRIEATVDRSGSGADMVIGQVRVLDSEGVGYVTLTGLCARRLDREDLERETLRSASLRGQGADRAAKLDGGPRALGRAGADLHREAILAWPAAERTDRLAGILAKELSRIIEMPEEELDPAGSLNRLGVDSMMALEFKTIVERSFEIHLSISQLLSGPSLIELAEAIVAQVVDSGVTAAAEAPLVDVEGLSDSQVAALLAEMMVESGVAAD